MIYNADELADLSSIYLEATGMTRTRLGLNAAANAKVVARLLDGLDCTTTAAERLSNFFDKNWPSGVRWPPTVPQRRRSAA